MPTSELSPKLIQNCRLNRDGGFGGGGGWRSLAHFQQKARDGWLVSPQLGQMTEPGAAPVRAEAGHVGAEFGVDAGATAAGAFGAAAAGSAAGGSAAAALAGVEVAGAAAASGLPQLPQNPAPDSLAVPQNGQVITEHLRRLRRARRGCPRRSGGRPFRG
jgi:hypothetical protein